MTVVFLYALMDEEQAVAGGNSTTSQPELGWNQLSRSAMDLSESIKEPRRKTSPHTPGQAKPDNIIEHATDEPPDSLYDIRESLDSNANSEG